MANLDSWDMIGRIYVGDHYTLLQSQYVGCFIQIWLVILRTSYDHVGIFS